MNPAALLGMAAVGLGLFFLSGKSGGGGGSSPSPEPLPDIKPKPHPEPAADCAATVQTLDSLEQAVLDELNEDPPDGARVCAAYSTYAAAVAAAQNGPCKDEIPATNIPDETAQQCSAPPQCQSLLMAVSHDAAVLIDLYEKDPDAQGDLCNAKRLLDASVAAAQAAGCTVHLPDDVPNFQCDNPPYVPPGTDCTAELAAYQQAMAVAQDSDASWNAGQTTNDMACNAQRVWADAASALVAKGCEVPQGGWGGPANGDPCQQPYPGKIDPACAPYLQDYQAKFNAYSAAMATGGPSAACPLRAGVQAAYDAARNAGCDMSRSSRLDSAAENSDCAPAVYVDPSGQGNYTPNGNGGYNQSGSDENGNYGGGGNVMPSCTADLSTCAQLRNYANSQAASGDLAGACATASQSAQAESQAIANGCDVSSLPAWGDWSCSSLVQGWRGWY